MTKRQKIIIVAGLVFGLIFGLVSYVVYALYNDSQYDVEQTYLTNITDSGFTLVWTSKNQYAPTLLYKEKGGAWLPILSQRQGKSELDDRDRATPNSKVERYSHHVSIGKLKPNSEYEFRIQGLWRGRGFAKTVKTLPLKDKLNTPDPAYGSVSGVHPTDSIILLERSGQQQGPIASAVIAPNQTYTIDLEPFQPVKTAADLKTTLINRRSILPSYQFKQPEFKPFETIVISYKGPKETDVSGKPTSIDKPEGRAAGGNNNGVSDFAVLPDYQDKDEDIVANDIELGSDPATDVDEETVVKESDPNIQEPDNTATKRSNRPSTDQPITGDPNSGGQDLPGGEPPTTPTPPTTVSGDIIDVPRNALTAAPTTPPTNQPGEPTGPTEPSEPTTPSQPKTTPVCVDNQTMRELLALQRNQFRQAKLAQQLAGSISAQVPPTTQGAEDNYLEVTEDGRIGFFEKQDKVAEKDIAFERDQRRIKVRLYYDNNGNGKKDADEEYMLSYSDIIYKREAIVMKFKLNAGWNLIHIPLIDSRIDTRIDSAKKLINYWEKQSADIKHIAKFENGRFVFTSKRESGKYYGEDFTLFPGDAIFVFSLRYNSEVTFSGNPFETSIPLQLTNGWNLVGIFSPNTEYTSETLINALEEQKYQVSTVSQFENGLYRSVVKDQDTLFGNNFNIVTTRGYFIKIENNDAQEFTP